MVVGLALGKGPEVKVDPGECSLYGMKVKAIFFARVIRSERWGQT